MDLAQFAQQTTSNAQRNQSVAETLRLLVRLIETHGTDEQIVAALMAEHADNQALADWLNALGQHLRAVCRHWAGGVVLAHMEATLMKKLQAEQGPQS